MLDSSRNYGCIMCTLRGQGCSSVGRASDQHAADAGSIPRCHKDFSPAVDFRCSSYLVHTPIPTRAITGIKICAHVKDFVACISVWWIMKPLKHPAHTTGWVALLCQSWLSSGNVTQISHGRNPNGTIQLLKKKFKNSTPLSLKEHSPSSPHYIVIHSLFIYSFL